MEARRAAACNTLSTGRISSTDPPTAWADAPRLIHRQRMSTWLDDRIQDMRAHLTPADEGSLWLLLLDKPLGAVVLACAVDDAMTHLDAGMASNLARIVREVPATAMLLVVPRADGRPRDVDRWLWRELQGLWPNSTDLVDLVVVGLGSYWSSRGLR